MEVKEIGEHCSCGGTLNKLYPVEPKVWRGICFVCGKEHSIIEYSGKDSDR